MASEQSFILDFTRSPSFFQNFNKEFDLDCMDGTVDGSFQLIIASYSPDNILDCLDEDGHLNEDVTVGVDEDGNDLIENIGLVWTPDSYGDGTIGLSDDVTFDIGDINTQIKAVFLINSDGYVMGYSINMVAIPVTYEVVFDEDVIFWDIRRYTNG